jgi:hypothetical protein
MSDMHNGPQPPRRDRVGLPSEHQIASVPRRYGAGTLLVITSAFAVLLTLCQALDFAPPWIIGVSVFFTGVGLAQMIAGPRRARRASLLAGVAFFPLMVITIVLYYSGFRRPDGETAVLVAGLLCVIMWGAPLGYVAGVLIGGIFLLMRYADAALARVKHTTADEEPIEVNAGDKETPSSKER